MLPDSVMKALVLLPTLGLAIAFEAIGATIIVRRRPLLLPAHWLAWLFTLFIVPLLVLMVSFQFSPYRDGIDFLLILQPLSFTLVLFIIWRQMQGYMVLGVAEAPMRLAMQSALRELNLPYEEIVSGFRLSTLEDTLQVSIQGWIGTAQFRTKSRRHGQELREIARATQRGLASEPSKPPMFTPIIYAAAGVRLLAMGVDYAIEF